MEPKYRNYGKIMLLLLACVFAFAMLLGVCFRSQKRQKPFHPDSASSFSKPSSRYTYSFEYKCYGTANPTKESDDPEQLANQNQLNRLIEDNQNYLNLGSRSEQTKLNQARSQQRNVANPTVNPKPSSVKATPSRNPKHLYEYEDIKHRSTPYTQEEFANARAFGFNN
ncbi:uncharacterized protein VICG_01756 [Vittaforma corneae ATCC 50505]|uniref:Uncharacterized protein n=1 Tax=Vittaforma corneae (strain ATCC 50505) TaxID=993615 RepID=L2GLK5_VITCO|nr:uncharacterized protein VICG_01756 [Vittaforma corneae ATCC 50505]ELA41157.1 hypothetical protein VICG_01756 [Vittaforma corneae ATCC 50505]